MVTTIEKDQGVNSGGFNLDEFFMPEELAKAEAIERGELIDPDIVEEYNTYYRDHIGDRSMSATRKKDEYYSKIKTAFRAMISTHPDDVAGIVDTIEDPILHGHLQSDLVQSRQHGDYIGRLTEKHGRFSSLLAAVQAKEASVTDVDKPVEPIPVESKPVVEYAFMKKDALPIPPDPVQDQPVQGFKEFMADRGVNLQAKPAADVVESVRLIADAGVTTEPATGIVSPIEGSEVVDVDEVVADEDGENINPDTEIQADTVVAVPPMAEQVVAVATDLAQPKKVEPLGDKGADRKVRHGIIGWLSSHGKRSNDFSHHGPGQNKVEEVA